MKEVVFGIDIGGTNTSYGIVDKEGNIIAKSSFPTQEPDTIEDYVNLLSVSLRNLLKESNMSLQLTGIGIGAPNGNYFQGTMDNPVNLKWQGIIPLAEMIKKEFAIPVFVTNDANAAAIGEMVFGAAKKIKDFIVVTLGTGLGSGFVVDGKLLYGSTGFAGELGHIIIDSNGRQCGCGRKGCLETYVSSTGITNTVKEMLKNTDETSILRNIQPDKLNSKHIYEAALENDSVAVKAFDFTSKLLGKSLADVVTITSPEVIFLFGGLALAGDFILKPAEKYMNQFMLRNFKGSVKLMQSGIEESNAAVLGAAALVLNEIKNK